MSKEENEDDITNQTLRRRGSSASRAMGTNADDGSVSSVGEAVGT